MKLTNQTNWGVVALLFLAFTALSVAELRELQLNTSEAVTLQAEKSAANYRKNIDQLSSLSPQTEELVLSTLLESTVSQPHISYAAIVDASGSVVAKREAAIQNAVPSWFTSIDSNSELEKRIPLGDSQRSYSHQISLRYTPGSLTYYLGILSPLSRFHCLFHC